MYLDLQISFINLFYGNLCFFGFGSTVQFLLLIMIHFDHKCTKIIKKKSTVLKSVHEYIKPRT